MAINFPVSLSSFFDFIEVAEANFTLGEARSANETNGGEIIDVSVGARLWGGSFRFRRAHHSLADQMSARVNALRIPTASFLMSTKHRVGPQSDPKGVALSGSNVTISAIAGDLSSINLSGLPSGFKLRSGDKLSFLYGENPTRYAFHEVYLNKTASGSGVASGVHVVPPIRAGAQVGTTVTLVAPFLKAKLVPNSVSDGSISRMFTEGLSLSWRQTLR